MGSLLLQEGGQALSPLSCLSLFVARLCKMWGWKRASSAAALARRIWLLNLLKLPLKAGSNKCWPRAHVDKLRD